MPRWTAALPLLLLLPGCLDGTSPPATALEAGPATAPAGNGTYWFVHVTGTEDDRGSVSISCDRGYSFTVDAEARRVEYAPAAHPYDPDHVTSLVAYEVDEFGGCPMAYGLQANSGAGPTDWGVLGRAWIVVDPQDGDAIVTMDGKQETVAPGQRLRLTGEGERREGGETWQAHADVAITNHGAWPRSGLLGVDDGPRW